MSAHGRLREAPFALPRLITLVAAIASSSGALASSHSDAPLIKLDPTANTTDVYAFVRYDDPDKLVFILNVIPFGEPGDGPIYDTFADSVAYDILVDTDRNAKEDVKIELRFRTEIRSGAGVLPYGGTGTLPITALDGPGSEGLGIRQTYSVFLARGSDGKFKKQNRIDLGLDTMFVVPPSIGDITTPNYSSLVQQGTYALANGGRAFAGPRDDSFYVDLEGLFDSVNFRRTPPVLTQAEDADDPTNSFGVDSLAGFNVHSIAIELPKSEITSDPNGVIGVWAATSRRQRSIFKGAPKLGPNDDRDDLRKTSGGFVQVSRMGNPFINELLIGTPDRDFFNATSPTTDASRVDYFLNPQIVPLLDAVLGANLPATGRTDLVATYLKYPGQDPNVCTPDSPCSDLLRVDLSVPPTPPGSQSRLGVRGGDAAGFPNGRRPGDDVLDIVVRSLTGDAASRAGDGVNSNDVALSTTFPYLATPHEGRDNGHDVCPTPGIPEATPTPSPAAAPTATPSPTPTVAPTPTPSPSPTPTGGTFVCSGVHAIPDPANPTSGHVFDSGECNQSMLELRFRIIGDDTYTSFTIPMPSGSFGSTNQPNDTVVGVNPNPATNIKTKIEGAMFTTAGPNPHAVEVTAKNAAGATSQHTVTIPPP